MLSVEQPLFPKDILGEPPLSILQSDPSERYILSILTLYHQLSRLPKLDPSPTVNDLFTNLVTLCAETPSEPIAEKITTDPRITSITPHLRHLCSDGESRLEAHWASKISTSTNSNAALANFPYYTNYTDLTRMELYAILSMSSTPPRTFAFLGSGPLPLTSLCLAAENPSLTIHNIDRDARAIALSAQLCAGLGARAKGLTFECADAGVGDLTAYDVVYLAALVGSTRKGKGEILKGVVGRMKVGALLVVRSAHSLRGLLYPVVDAAEDLLGCGVVPLLTVHPYNHIVNSVVIGRVTGRK